MLANAVETFFAPLTRRTCDVTPSVGSSIREQRSIDFSPFMVKNLLPTSRCHHRLDQPA